MRYAAAAQLPGILADTRTLAVIRFGSQTRTDPAEPRLLTVGLPELTADRQTLEIWQSPDPVRTGRAGDIGFSSNREVLFAALAVDQAHYPDLTIATRSAYERLLTLLRRRDYPHLLRVWHYFPAINAPQNGLERYRAFCQGRHRALAGPAFEQKLPAASAIGTHSGKLLIYCLAAKRPGRQIENPRQLSAFRYPAQYGPRSPSFSRALLQSWGTGEHQLYISGTASIVGHATRHSHDADAQLTETLANLDALIAHANHHSRTPFALALLKVYLRGGLQPAVLGERLARHYGPVPTVMLRGDICRGNLLLEIEGLALAAADFS